LSDCYGLVFGVCKDFSNNGLHLEVMVLLPVRATINPDMTGDDQRNDAKCI